ncbi:MAG TPA: hypothetical protein VK907_04975, partial [Phnomibacter sp.]|nr:hypothetical protein [Phnomibacter sp.]
MLPLMTIAQFDQLLNKTYAQRADDINQIYVKILSFNTTEQGFEFIEAFSEFAQRSGDKELVLETQIMEAYYLSVTDTSHQRTITALEATIGKARQQRVSQVEARATEVLANYYWNKLKNYELAFEQYLALTRVLAAMPDEAYPDKMAALRNIGYAHYHFADHHAAIKVLRQASAITISDFNRRFFFDVVNTIGLCFQKLGYLDSADHYFMMVIEPLETYPDPTWQKIAKGNLGYSQFLRRNFADAIPLLQADIDGAIQSGDLGLAAGSLIPLATIFLEQGKIADADALARQAVDFVNSSGQLSRYQYLYPLLAKLSAAHGQARQAAQYIDSAYMVKDSLAREFNSLQLLRAHQRVELREKEAMQASLAFEKRSKIIERNAMLAVVVLLIVLALYIYYSTRQKLRQEQALKSLQLEEKERELIQAADKLNEFALSIQEKNRLIENLEQQFGDAENSGVLEELRQSTILTDADWDKFRSSFERVHTGYLDRLRSRFPHLTPAEVR